MAWYPKARKKEIRPGSNDPKIKVVGAILHVDAGNSSSLYTYFNGPSNGIESHFHVRKDGVVEQYRNTGYEADANYKANSFVEGGVRKGYVSIETQGLEHGEWNAKQMAAIKELLLWLSETHGFPLDKCSDPKDPGVGYHTLFGAPGPWTPVSKSCPGPDRKRQFQDELVPWMREQRKGGNDPKPAPKPDNDKPETYTVKPGDTLTEIAEKKDTTVGELVKDNKIKDPDKIQVGDKLKIHPDDEKRQDSAPKPERVEALKSGVKPGKSHPQVRDLQRLLIKAGYGPIPHAVTDFYGDETKAAVIRFHNRNPRFKAYGVNRDPEIGPKGFIALQRQAGRR